MVIDVDLGNTRIKWRGADGVINSLDTPQMPEMLARLPQGVERVRVCSVIAEERSRQFAEFCRQNLGISAEFAQPVDGVGGLMLAYREAHTLGADRWLAMLAARRLYPETPLLVVSAGTALTADLISAEGVHQGGFIVPGLGTALRSLAQSAARLPLVSFSRTPVERPGATTLECIESGTALLYRGYMRELCQMVSGPVADLRVVFTGGEGQQLQSLAGSQVCGSYHPALVLDGLAGLDGC